MTAPLDLTRHLGEGWCVTVTPLAPALTLDMMGARDVAGVPDGVGRASRRIAERRPEVLLLAKPATGYGSLVLEVEGTVGWIGLDPDVLGELSEAGTACSIGRDPNRVNVLIAEDGEVVAGLDAVTLLRWGTLADRSARALAAAGFPGDDEEPGDEISRWTPSQCAALALAAVTGVTLDDGMLADPWLGGLSAGAPA
jgi:hypothetical protein